MSWKSIVLKYRKKKKGSHFHLCVNCENANSLAYYFIIQMHTDKVSIEFSYQNGFEKNEGHFWFIFSLLDLFFFFPIQLREAKKGEQKVININFSSVSFRCWISAHKTKVNKTQYKSDYAFTMRMDSICVFQFSRFQGEFPFIFYYFIFISFLFIRSVFLLEKKAFAQMTS